MRAIDHGNDQRSRGASATVTSDSGPVVGRPYPQIIKYMGSKASIIDFVLEGIGSVYAGGPVCDLFAGAGSLAGALGASVSIRSNDIQAYSSVLAGAYLYPVSGVDLDGLLRRAKDMGEERAAWLPEGLDHSLDTSLRHFNIIEERNRKLIRETPPFDYHLFVKSYSGTWWSARQCAWIDAIRGAIDSENLALGDRSVLLSALMHAMAYASQGTGHYAQYRDAKDLSSMKDILTYRTRNVFQLFERKARALYDWNHREVRADLNHATTSSDYRKILADLDGGTVYADPPYAFVHYSRFYHAIETLVLYDYPRLQVKGGSIVKGRYREERHQSPFCIRSKVAGAFEAMFEGVRDSGANLALSYSNSGMISLDELLELGRSSLGTGYRLDVLRKAHSHMTMGRRADRSRDIEEVLILGEKI